MNLHTTTHHFCIRSGGAFEGIEDAISPFGYKRGEGIDAGSGEVDWICNRDRVRTDALFETLGPVDGKISGAGKNLLIQETFLYKHLKLICIL